MYSLKKIIGFTVAGAVISIAANAQTLTNAQKSTLDTRFSPSTSTQPAAIEGLELLEKMGRYEKDLFVYRAAKPSEAQIAERFVLAKRFAEEARVKLTEKPQQLGDQRIALMGADDASASFEVDQLTGNFLFASGMEKYGKDAGTIGLPKAEDLPELAARALKQYDLPVKPEELMVAHSGGVNLSVADGSAQPRIYEKLKTLRYSRLLNGLPVEGDSRIVMHFGENAELAGMVYQIPQISAARKLSATMLQPTDSLKRQALAELAPMAKKALRAKLTKVDLVIYDDGKGVMEPAYHIVMERLMNIGGKEPVMIPYDFYIPVSRQPAAFFPHMETSLFVPEDGASTKGGMIGDAQ